jgi:hypothetical protein
MISRRGVCFFRGQDISSDDMMLLQEKIADLTGRPKESGEKNDTPLLMYLAMCIHPVSKTTPEIMAGTKRETMEISAEKQRKGGGINRRFEDVSRWVRRA